MRDVRCRVRSPVAQLRAALAALALLAFLAASPAPAPTFSPPKVALHADFLVQTNKLGQVTHVQFGKLSNDKLYNFETYGNAVQTFIRTPDGKAVAGTFRLNYDYDPKTKRIRRDVVLVKVGGVNPNAEGMANRMIDDAKRGQAAAASAAAVPTRPPPHPISVDTRLPSLQKILETPTPEP